MTLNEVMKETADAIREKKGTTDKIAPINFAEEIKGITAGGGESGGENTYEYIELTRPEGWEGDDFIGEVVRPLLYACALLVKLEIYGSMAVTTSYVSGMQRATPIAIAYDPNMLVQGETGFIKVSEVFQIYGLPELPRLTKEQFYDLNA